MAYRFVSIGYMPVLVPYESETSGESIRIGSVGYIPTQGEVTPPTSPIKAKRIISTGYLPASGAFVPNPGPEIDYGTGHAYRILLDTDGSPYFGVFNQSNGFGIELDTDENPYWIETQYHYVIRLDTDLKPYFESA